jgi:hypothetical protein
MDYIQNININELLDEFGLDWIRPLDKTETETNEFALMRGWNETRWIVISSSFFSIPAVWHLANHFSYIVEKTEGFIEGYKSSSQYNTDENEKNIQILLYLSVVFIITSIISINYWRDATRGWRRNADLIFAKFSVLTASYYFIRYVTYTPYLIITYTSFPIMLYVYNEATKRITENNPNWVYYHVLFHIFLTIIGSVLLEVIQRRICKIQITN